MTEHSWLYPYANPIGIVGVAIILLAYMLLQLHRMSAHSLAYTTVNAVGSVLILISLYYHMNIASLIIEIAWLAISLYGMWRAYKKIAAAS